MEGLLIFGGLAGGLALGFTLATLIQKGRQGKTEAEKSALQERCGLLDAQLQQLSARHEELNKTDQKLKEDHAALTSRLEHYAGLESQLEKERSQSLKLNQDYAGLLRDHENLKLRMAEEKAQIEQLQKKFSDAFEKLANEVLDQKSKKFTDLNQTQMEGILKPLQEKIKEFQEKVEKSYIDGLEKNAALSSKIEEIQKMASTLSTEAHQLTKALKGENKIQGNWGEILLERILETSGMQDGKHYQKQMNLKNHQGETQIPDVVVSLPGNRHLIIDSKVSLVAYERWVNADSEELQKEAAKDLVKSIEAHVSGLSGKNYQHLEKLHSPDFVFLFLPIEPVLGLALKEKPDLLDRAWKQKIMILTPTTLSATLWTIQNVWQQERQMENIEGIFKTVSSIYDKLMGFLESLEKVGKAIENTQDAYQKSLGQLRLGKGNALGQMEKLKSMGITSSKTLPASFQSYEALEAE